MRKVGLMIDCSRNAVKNIDTLKKIIDLSKKLDFTALYLYMEDVYTLEGEPYFGHMRGRYTFKELKEIDDYGFNKGIEIIPCIQTLAHLNQMFVHYDYDNIKDWDDILLCNSNKTYELIDKMFKFLRKTFRTNFIHCGMDEAYMIGHGNYLKYNPYEPTICVFLKHLAKVDSIAKKYGYDIAIYGDSIQSINYDKNKLKECKNYIHLIPKDINITYWNYYRYKESDYDKPMNAISKIPNTKLMYACGAWNWAGFAPINREALATMKPGIKVANKYNVNNIMITCWGDNGNECSLFAVLPAIFYASQLIKKNYKLSEIKKVFYDTFGIKFNDFMKADLPNMLGQENLLSNPSKYMLYNDPIIGLLDKHVPDGVGKIYSAHARKLKKLSKTTDEYGYVFKYLSSLCSVLSIKAELGIRTYKAYRNKNKDELNILINDYTKSIKLINNFIKDFRYMWNKENKSFGFEIQETRLGGLLKRIECSRDILKQFLKGDIKVIPELEEERLEFHGPVYEFHKKLPLTNVYNLIISNSKL